MSRREKLTVDVFESLLVVNCELTPRQKAKYIDKKIRMLNNDFKLPVYEEDIAYLNTLNTEAAIDRACSRIIKTRL